MWGEEGREESTKRERNMNSAFIEVRRREGEEGGVENLEVVFHGMSIETEKEIGGWEWGEVEEIRKDPISRSSRGLKMVG